MQNALFSQGYKIGTQIELPSREAMVPNIWPCLEMFLVFMTKEVLLESGG